MGKPGEFFIQPRGAGRVAAPADHNLQGAESELQCGTGVRAAASVRPGRVKRVRVGEANLQQKDKYLQTLFFSSRAKTKLCFARKNIFEA